MTATHSIPATAARLATVLPFRAFHAALTALLALSGCMVGEPPGVYGDASRLSPSVVHTAPAHLDSGVALDAAVTATFSEPMQPDSVNERTFLLLRPMLGGGFDTVAGTVTYDPGSLTATFTPDDSLWPGTLYRAVITVGAVDLQCSPPDTTHTWTFTTETPPCVEDPFDPPPALTRAEPEDLEGNVAPDAIITATFNEPMDPASINEETFIVVRLTAFGPDTIEGTVSYSAGDTTAVFIPEDDLLPGQTYRAYLTGGTRDYQCSPLYKTFTWTFTVAEPPPPACVNDPFDAVPTVTRTDPADLEGDVAPDAIITATFSEPMDPASINEETFVVVRLTAFGPDTIKGTVTYSAGDTTAIFTPDEDLLPGQSYRAYLTITVKDAQCTPLATTFAWNFTIDTPTPPPSCIDDPFDAAPNDIRRSPEILEPGVPLNTLITVTFNEPMDPASINNSTFYLFHYHDNVTDTIKGTVTVLPGDTVAIFDPLADLLPGEFYQAVITTVARDAQCSPLDTPVYIPFTTYTPQAPKPPQPEAINNGVTFSLTAHNNPILELYWFPKPGPNPGTYRIQVSSGPAFSQSSIVFDLANIPNNTFIVHADVPIANLPPATYYWRVNATNSFGTSPWSVVWTFTTTP
jgi:hypothetical protein